MLTEEERNDLERTLMYGDPFGGGSAQDLRQQLLSLDSEATKYKEALEIIETGADLAIDSAKPREVYNYLRQIKAKCAFALRGEVMGTGQHRATEESTK